MVDSAYLFNNTTVCQCTQKTPNIFFTESVNTKLLYFINIH